jgi:hypothetical protein
MARRTRSSILYDLARLITLALMLSYASAIGFWDSIPEKYRSLIAVLGVVILVCGVISVTMFVIYRNRQRKLAWRRAMVAWQDNSPSKQAPEFVAARFLSPRDLEKFAVQVYRKLGYRVARTGRTGDRGVDLRLINPHDEIELAQCKQWNTLVGEPQIRDLYAAMTHAKAVKGYVWAPGGFSQSARQWVKGKPIVLLDNEEIGRLVESAYLKK